MFDDLIVYTSLFVNYYEIVKSRNPNLNYLFLPCDVV